MAKLLGRKGIKHQVNRFIKHTTGTLNRDWTLRLGNDGKIGGEYPSDLLLGLGNKFSNNGVWQKEIYSGGVCQKQNPQIDNETHSELEKDFGLTDKNTDTWPAMGTKKPKWEILSDSSNLFLSGKFTFKDFDDAFNFMKIVSEKCNELNHHPKWTNVYNKIDVELFTHDIGGLSYLDFELAKFMDSSFLPYSQ